MTPSVKWGSSTARRRELQIDVQGARVAATSVFPTAADPTAFQSVTAIRRISTGSFATARQPDKRRSFRLR